MELTYMMNINTNIQGGINIVWNVLHSSFLTWNSIHILGMNAVILKYLKANPGKHYVLVRKVTQKLCHRSLSEFKKRHVYMKDRKKYLCIDVKDNEIIMREKFGKRLMHVSTNPNEWSLV